MASWHGDQVDLELEGITEVEVRVVGGEVSVATSSTGPTRLQADVVQGRPLDVELEDGVLVVTHERDSKSFIELFGVQSLKAVVNLVVPPSTPVTVRSVSADVFVDGVASDVHIGTVSGAVTMSGVQGDVAAKTVSGSIEAQGIDGTLDATTVSGHFSITDADLDRVSVRSVSGEITLDLSRESDVSVTTVSGDVALRLPSDANLDLDATSTSGRLDSAFELADLRRGKRRLSGRVGDGGRRVSIRTVSGDFALLRKAVAAA